MEAWVEAGRVDQTQAPVCVLGLGRSGTSLAARVLNILGVDLGAEAGMLPASEINRAGFWEQEAIIALNDEILAVQGGTYVEPPPLAPGWQADPRLAPTRQKMGDLVQSLFGGDARWGFKDPRTAFTLPLWQEVVGEMAYLICVRDPFEAAASHQVGWPQYDTDHYLGLWLRANAATLRATEGSPRVVVRYDDWFAKPEAVTERLLGLLRPGAPVATDAELTAIRAHVQPELHHQRAAGPPLEARPDVALEVRAMAAVLDQMAGWSPDADREPLQLLATTLDDAWSTRRAREQARAAEQEAALSRAVADRDRLAQERDVLARQHGELAREREVLTAELQRVGAALATIESSKSWRMTGALRSAAARLRAVRRSR